MEPSSPSRKYAQTATRLILVLLIFCLPIGTAHASSPATPPCQAAAEDDPPGDAADTLISIFMDLGKLAIRVLYALMFVVFAVGMVKSGLGAQAAQAFGATGRVSAEMMNLAGGIVIFVIGLLTLPIANMIIDRVSSGVFTGSIDIHNPLSP